MIRFLLFLIVKMAGASHQANSYLKIGHSFLRHFPLFSKELGKNQSVKYLVLVSL